MNIFPPEINNLIHEFTGKIKWRNGKYMKQIPLDDDRYAILDAIPKKLGGPCMIYSEICYLSWVKTDFTNHFIVYRENHPNFTSGEIHLEYTINDSNYTHIIGNKYPPLWIPARFTNKKHTSKHNWIEYLSDDE